jgi:hypothetical protein
MRNKQEGVWRAVLMGGERPGESCSGMLQDMMGGKARHATAADAWLRVF